MKVMIPGNICAALKRRKLSLFNNDVFGDLHFAPSEVNVREMNLEKNQTNSIKQKNTMHVY